MSSFFRSSKNKPAFTSAKKDSSPKKLFLKLASSDHPEPVNYSERGIHPESHGGLHANPSRFASDYVAPHARKLEERSKSVSHLEKSDKGKDLGTSSKPISRGKDRERTQSLNTPAKEIPLAKSTSKNGSKDSNRKERLVDPLVKETQTSSLFQRRRTVSTGGPAGRDPTPSDENRSFSDLRRSPKKKYSPSGRKLELVEEEDKVREWLHVSCCPTIFHSSDFVSSWSYQFVLTYFCLSHCTVMSTEIDFSTSSQPVSLESKVKRKGASNLPFPNFTAINESWRCIGSPPSFNQVTKHRAFSSELHF